MGEGRITDYRHLRGDAAGLDHIAGMLSPAQPPRYSVRAQGPPRSRVLPPPPGMAGEQSWAALARRRSVPAPGPPPCLLPSSLQLSAAPQEQRESPACGSAPPAKDKSVRSRHSEGGQMTDLFVKQENSFLVLKGYNQDFYEAINYLLIIKSKLNVHIPY